MFWVIFFTWLLDRVSVIIWGNWYRGRCFRLWIYPLLLALLVQVCPIDFLLQLQWNGTRDIVSPWGLFNNTFPFTIPLPLPLPILYCLPHPRPFPLPVLSRLPFPLPISVPYPFPVLLSPPCVSASPLQWSLLLASRRQLLPPLSAPVSAQFSSSLFSSIIWSQFSARTATKSPGLWFRQLGGSIFVLRSVLPYQEKRSPVDLTFPKLDFCRLERFTSSRTGCRSSHLQLFIWSWVVPNICPVYERKAAHDSENCEHRFLRCGHISWNCEQCWVMTGSRKIIS